jgi:hypothetical protein
MSDVRITDLPLILSGDIRNNNVLPIVNVSGDTTNKITLSQLKTYVNSGNTDVFVTGGTYSAGTTTFTNNTGGTFNVTGFTAGASLYEVGSGTCSTQRVGVSGCAIGNYSIVAGGSGNTSLSSGSTIGGGFFNTISSCSGYYENGGGFSIIGGGFCNTSDVNITTISGGWKHTITSSGYDSTIGGGRCHTASCGTSTIAGGYNNTSTNYDTFIGGGGENVAGGNGSVVTGGEGNTALSYGSVIGGGNNNTIDLDTLSGEYYYSSVIGGGYCNTILSCSGNYISGAQTISGGYKNVSAYNYATIGGGCGNTTLSCYATIAGGENSTIMTNSDYSTISGGEDHLINGQDSTIGGGENNTIIGEYSIIGGGFYNTLNSDCSTISGGYCNTSGIRGVITGSGTVTYSGTVTNTSYGISPSSTTSGYGTGSQFQIVLISNGITSTSLVSYSGSLSNGYYGNYSPSSTSSGYGSNSQFAFDIYFGSVTNIYLNSQGKDYVNGDNLTFLGSLFGGTDGVDDVVIKVDSTQTVGYAIKTNGGENYVNGDDLTFLGSLFGGTDGPDNVVIQNIQVRNYGSYSTISGGYCNTSNSDYTSIGGGNYNTIGDLLANTLIGQTINGGSCNTITPFQCGCGCGTRGGSTISGGYKNTTLSSNYGYQTIGGGRFNLTSTDYSTVSGGYRNLSMGYSSFIGGGVGNISCGGQTTISGGYCNTSSGYYSTVSGGYCNTSSNYSSSIGGGRNNTSSCNYSVVSGGFCNVSNNYSSSIGGGRNNTISNSYSTISGGYHNTSSGYASTVSGGYNNTSSSCSSTVGGGFNNTINQSTASNYYTVVGNLIDGGNSNSIDTNLIPDASNDVGGQTIGGGYANQMFSSQYGFNTIDGGVLNRSFFDYSTIGGGAINVNLESFTTIGGGVFNTNSSYVSTIGGGQNNTIGTLSSNYDLIGQTIAGGTYNTISSYSGYYTNGGSTISGGYRNTTVSSEYGGQTIGGGWLNTTSDDYVTVGGGLRNTSSGGCSTVSGGYMNKSIGIYSTVSGGYCNMTLNDYSTVSGGRNNTSRGGYSTVSGGYCNVAGINGVVNQTYNAIYNGGTFSGYYGPYSPSSTSSGLGSDATFSFYFIAGTLSNVYIDNGGYNYQSSDLLTFNGSLFGGTTGVDNVTFYIGTTSKGISSFIGGGAQNTITGDNSSVIGGSNIIGTADNMTYVPNLNINSTPTLNNSNTQVLSRNSSTGNVEYMSSVGSYSNVIFVDSLLGNDSTAVIGNSNKPCQSISRASYLASTLTNTSTSKALIYVRKGSYTFNGDLQNYLDYYSEPGVVFTSGLISDSTFGAVVSNFYGYAILINTPVDLRSSSSCNFEFDYMSNNGTAFYVAPASGLATVNIKANYIYTTSLGSGFGSSIRNNSNVTFNVSRGIESTHSTISFRFFTGNVVINCPYIYLGSGNLYGGNYKQAVVFYDSTTSGSTIINGNIVNKDTVDYGGIGSLVTVYSSANPKLIINGDIKGGPIKALDGNTYTNATIEINGDISSDNSTYTAWAYGGGEVLFKNCVIKNSGLNSSANLIAVNGTGSIFFKDCYLYNQTSNSNLIVVNNASTKLILDGVGGVSEGASGNSIYSTVGAVNVRVNNSRFNKDKSVDITDIYSPTGFVYDTNTKVPTLI